MAQDLLDTLTVERVQELFDTRYANNVQSNWPEVAIQLRTAGLAGDPIMLAYALATIRTETGSFSPKSEGASKLSRGRDDRPFGAYDQVALKKNQTPNIRFTKDGHVRLTDSSSGDRPHRADTWLDPDVSGENAWRELKGLPRRDIDPAADNDGERYRGRGYVQLTGLANYRAADQALNLGLVEDPDRASIPQIAAKILVWFLKARQNKIRQHLGGVTKNYVLARAQVNGLNKDGTVNGLDDFTEAYDAADELLRLKTPPSSVPPTVPSLSTKLP